MLKIYLKLSVRNLLKNRLFSFINITGLALGIATALLLFLYINNELLFDKNQSNGDFIYRLVCNTTLNNTNEKWGCSPNIAGPTFLAEATGIKEQARVVRHNFGDAANVKFSSKKFFENNLYWADGSVLKIFDFDIIKGDRFSALSNPYSIIINENVARKYFGDEDPIGKTLSIDNTTACQVTAVYKNFPSNFSFDAEIIGSITSIDWMHKNLVWSNASFETYVLLDESSKAEAIEKKINEITAKKVPDAERWFSFSLQPLRDIHLQSDNIQNTYIKNAGDKKQVTIVSILVLAILLIASINYMNLATARSQRRFKEVGICKTIGAQKSELVKRFYLETILLVLCSVLISLIILWISLPYFNTLAETHLSLKNLLNARVLEISALSVFVIILISGSYPALYLSSFNAKNLFSPNVRSAKFTGKLRQLLVVVQFSVAILLIFCTLILYKQLHFLQTKNLGFEASQVISLTTTGAENREQLTALGNSLKSLSFVESVSRSQTYPGKSGSGRSIYHKNNANESKNIVTCRAGSDIVNVLGIKFLAGKPLEELKSDKDTTFQVVLNRTAVEFIGYTPEEAIGKKIQLVGSYDEIVGVVEDFNFETLHQPVGAYAFHNAPTETRPYMLMKVRGEFTGEKLDQVKKVFTANLPNAAFEYTLLNQYINSLYKKESQTSRITLFFSGLTIFLACLGLFGLSAYMIELRIKEMGIRKVFGASNISLINLLSRKFLWLVLIAALIAFPVAYVTMKKWLINFPQHITIDIGIFIATLIIILLTSMLTVSLQAIKAAISSPVQNLKTD